jgi:hypothetical protein
MPAPANLDVVVALGLEQSRIGRKAPARVVRIARRDYNPMPPLLKVLGETGDVWGAAGLLGPVIRRRNEDVECTHCSVRGSSFPEGGSPVTAHEQDEPPEGTVVWRRAAFNG